MNPEEIKKQKHREAQRRYVERKRAQEQTTLESYKEMNTYLSQQLERKEQQLQQLISHLTQQERSLEGQNISQLRSQIDDLHEELRRKDDELNHRQDLILQKDNEIQRANQNTEFLRQSIEHRDKNISQCQESLRECISRSPTPPPPAPTPPPPAPTPDVNSFVQQYRMTHNITDEQARNLTQDLLEFTPAYKTLRSTKDPTIRPIYNRLNRKFNIGISELRRFGLL